MNYLFAHAVYVVLTTCDILTGNVTRAIHSGRGMRAGQHQVYEFLGVVRFDKKLLDEFLTAQNITEMREEVLVKTQRWPEFQRRYK